MLGTLVAALTVAAFVVFVATKVVVVVPEKFAYVVERLGHYDRTLTAGLSLLIPFVDKVRHKQSLKDAAIDMPEQSCITRDNVQVRIDGVMYLKVVDAEYASYGVADYKLALMLLSQTSLRSEVNRFDLTQLFASRNAIKASVLADLEKTGLVWGVRVMRYEIKNILPPPDLLATMNKAEGEKQQLIKHSEASRARQIHDSEAEASRIRAVADATAEGIRTIGAALRAPGGLEAMQLRVAEQYVARFGDLAKQGATVVIPSNPTEFAAMMTSTNPLRKDVVVPGRPPDDKGEPS